MDVLFTSATLNSAFAISTPKLSKKLMSLSYHDHHTTSAINFGQQKIMTLSQNTLLLVTSDSGGCNASLYVQKKKKNEHR